MPLSGEKNVKKYREPMPIVELSNDDLVRLFNLIEDLNWDYDRLSTGGKKTMDEINEILNN